MKIMLVLNNELLSLFFVTVHFCLLPHIGRLCQPDHHINSKVLLNNYLMFLNNSFVLLNILAVTLERHATDLCEKLTFQNGVSLARLLFWLWHLIWMIKKGCSSVTDINLRNML
jgi:hypothetical protein